MGMLFVVPDLLYKFQMTCLRKMDLNYRAETKCGKFEFLSYLKCYELHIYIKRYSSCALTSMTNNIGLLFCLRLVGLLV